MPVRYVCDSCGHRGIAPGADTVDEVQCEMCGEPVLKDLDAEPRPRGRQSRRQHRQL